MPQVPQLKESTSLSSAATKALYPAILRVFTSSRPTGIADNSDMTRPVRKTLRAPAEFLGTLELLSANEPGLAYGIRVTDVSSTGIGITLRGDVPVGTPVRLVFETGTVEGTVVYSRAEKGHFAAGVQVERNATALSPLRWAASLKLHDAFSSWPKTHVPV